MVEVSGSEDNFEVFNRPQSLEVLTGDFSHLPLIEVSQTQGDLSVPEAIGIQCKARSSLQELLESQAGGNALGKAAQTKLPTPPPTQSLRSNPANRKRKREQKGKEVVEVGKSH